MIDSPAGVYRPAQESATECDGAARQMDPYLAIGWSARFWTRALDLLLAVIGLILAAPLFGLVAALIKTESEGPGLLLAASSGLHRKRFWMLKFRKMRANSADPGAKHHARA